MGPIGKKPLTVALGTLLGSALGAISPLHAQDHDQHIHATATPIKHVILIIGENRTFDHVFGTFKPNPGETIENLLSEGIVNANGTPGPNFNRAIQWQATDTGAYSIHPVKTVPYQTLGPVTTTGTPADAPYSSVSAAQEVEPALPTDAYRLLTIGGSGLAAGSTVDTRFPDDLANGPYDITQYLSYDDYAGSPVHRFFQMWQQADCDRSAATPRNPSGCQNDLWPWVEATVGAGSNGKPQAADYAQNGYHEGPISMGFYNMADGDESYFAQLAREYAMSDNFHQAVMGGTGANHVAIGYGTALYYANAKGKPATPPANQIENPDAQPGTNNFYTEDGYSGGSYVNCADAAQPGVAPIRDYLKSLPYPAFRNGNCQPHAYYLENN
ncbi:MAG: alkaline phosphatase family protein, partial [Gammaproteobacteria bacterium]